MLHNYASVGRQNWVSQVRNILYQFGFGYIWESQSVDNNGHFLKEFTRRLMDCDLQNWNTQMCSLPKLRTYSVFKSELIVEPYLLMHIPHIIRASLARFRIGVHQLAIEQGRHCNLKVEDRICQFCNVTQQHYIEDEYHVLLHCPLYEDLRIIYLDIQKTPRNMYLFTNIMCCQMEDLVKLGCFITNMFKSRKYYLNNIV